MEPGFWHTKWETGEIGFHEHHVHALLEAHWPALDVEPGAAVLAPLCGKSLDMVWLRERGHEVVGVELSPIAVRDFFAGQALDPACTRRGAHALYSADGYRLWCGDYMTLTAGDIGPVGGVYDRAALIALPPAMRAAYARQTLALVPGRARLLVITLQFDAALFDGPPFPVGHDEIERLYAGAAAVEHLEQSPTRVKGRFDVLQTATRIDLERV